MRKFAVLPDHHWRFYRLDEANARLFEGFFMNRDEAVLFIKELLENCASMENIYLCMIPPTADTPIVTHGYQVHIQKTRALDEETAECIKNIAERHKLSAMEDEQRMIIFRPT